MSIELARKSLSIPVCIMEVLRFPIPLPAQVVLIDGLRNFCRGVVFVATESSSSSSEKSETELAREGI